MPGPRRIAARRTRLATVTPLRQVIASGRRIDLDRSRRCLSRRGPSTPVTTSPASPFAGRDLQSAGTNSPFMVEFPDFVQQLPEADATLRRVTLRILLGRTASQSIIQPRG